MRHGLAALVVVAVGAAPAAAAPAAADFVVFISTGVGAGQLYADGATVDVGRLAFRAGALVDNDGGEEATARFRFTLPDGLRYGADGPDPSESCTAAAVTTECGTSLLIGTDPSRRSQLWLWDVAADRPGRYMLRAEIVQTSVSDPVPANNAASITVVVTESGGGGGSLTMSASTVRTTPAKPKAGAAVSATVRVTAGGAPVRPTGVACAGSVGGGKLRGAPRSGSGSATCVYLPPKSARGKVLRGTISFTARSTKFTRRFSTKLG